MKASPRPTNPGLAKETPAQGWSQAVPQPAEVFHPGEYIHDEMLERGMSRLDMERATGISHERWLLLCDMQVGLLGSEAEALERIGWGSALMWLALNRRWHERTKR